MGAFLFYLLKSTLCLTLFYVLYRFCFRGDTLFRTNRVLLLGGTMLCLALPGVHLEIAQGGAWQQSVSIVEKWLAEETFQEETRWSGEVEVVSYEDASVLPVRSVLSGGRKGIGFVIPLYLCGVLLVSGFFLFSCWQMWRLVKRCPVRRKYQDYYLVICPQRNVSFSWGRTIVLSEEDYKCHRDAVLLHERMHVRYRHTWDLLWMEAVLVLHWFNPAVWMLMHELRAVHEYEADKGVLSEGIDATQYQLLLVKRAVGTRLYSMANGFGQSKLKKRISMMLKKRTSGLARLKLLLFVPVAAGTLYAFARPEVRMAVPDWDKPQVNERQDSIAGDRREWLEQYFARKYEEGGGPADPIAEKETHTLFINYQNQVMVDDVLGPKTEDLSRRMDFIRTELSEILRRDYREKQQAGQPFRPVVQFRYDRGSSSETVSACMEVVKEVYDGLHREVDAAIPVLVNVKTPRKYVKHLFEADSLALLPVEVILLSSDGSRKALPEVSLKSLRQEAEAFRAGKRDMTVSLRIKDSDVPMGVIEDVKEVLRKAYVK